MLKLQVMWCKMSTWSKSWKSSKQPRKQRLYQEGAPYHIRSGMMTASLSKELREKHKRRSVRVRIGDIVLVLRGQFRKRRGKVERVDVARQKIYVEGVEQPKKDGSKAKYPLHPSNIQVTELGESTKRRIKKNTEKKQSEAKNE